MTPNAERVRATNDNPFEELWDAVQSRDGAACRSAVKRIDREFRHIERRISKGSVA